MRFFGLIGIVFILLLAFLMSNNRKRINWHTIISGLLLQVFLAIFILKTSIGQNIFNFIGQCINKLLEFSSYGGDFVFGVLTKTNLMHNELFGNYGDYLFALTLIPTIIFVAVLVAIAYHLGIMQRLVSLIAKVVTRGYGPGGAARR